MSVKNDTKMTAESIDFFRSENCAEAECLSAEGSTERMRSQQFDWITNNPLDPLSLFR